MRARRTAIRCVAFAALVTLAGCAGTGTPSPPASSAPAMSDEALLALGKQVVQCMRDNGLTDMPDPYVEEHRLAVPEDEMEAVEEKAGEEKFRIARDACQDVFDRIPQGAIAEEEPEGPAPPGPQDVETLRKYAQCYRDNGVPEWPDPDSDGRFPLRGTALEDERPEPGNRLDTARKACEKIWSGPIGIS
ncbi:hypothetical protein AB0G04_07575 [Actinoplanes sp. NPDC023801]|uniref:hypothetical protein n=1 Tax=Actinoplanes sp. NPDC023801 TaxID=3154595 RepID=UPI0033DF72FA